MSQSLSHVIVHIIFSTKDRAASIPPTLEPKLHAYIAGIIRNNDSDAFRVGGTSNHIHIACTLPKTITQCDLVKTIKTESSKWFKRQGLQEFHWQRGYGIFSVSSSQCNSVIAYIDNQYEHHKKTTFQEEFKAFLHKHNIKYNEEYLWD